MPITSPLPPDLSIVPALTMLMLSAATASCAVTPALPAATTELGALPSETEVRSTTGVFEACASTARAFVASGAVQRANWVCERLAQSPAWAAPAPASANAEAASAARTARVIGATWMVCARRDFDPAVFLLPRIVIPLR